MRATEHSESEKKIDWIDRGGGCRIHIAVIEIFTNNNWKT